MKLLVLVGISMCISNAIAVSTEMKAKMSHKINSIQLPIKTDMMYSHSVHDQAGYLPMSLMQKPYLISQPQPQPAMIIIAQPALMPHGFLYGGGHALGLQQQLLNYFHGNPQAKYQLLYGGAYQPHPTHQPYMPQAPMAAPTVAAYQIVPSPILHGYNHLVAAPSQVTYAQSAPLQNHIGAQYVQPMQLNQLAHLAQLSASQLASPVKAFPPIITGLENFTPEQQAQIKAQLSSHLGAPLATASTVPTTMSPYTQPISTQPSHTVATTEYMHNGDKTNQQVSSSNFSPSLIYRAQYTKG